MIINEKLKAARRSIRSQKIEDIVTEGLNSVYDELNKCGHDDEAEFIEAVADAAREYAKICVEAGYEQNHPGATV